MSTARRVLISVGAPLVMIVGLAFVWGLRNASRIKAQIEMWADSLEHSPNPVEMRLGFLPMYVEGEKIGKLGTVVVQRREPATVDSLSVQVLLSDHSDLTRLAGCGFLVDPDAVDRSGPMGFKQVVRCVSDMTDLVRFGSMAFTGTGRMTGLYLQSDDLPCDWMGSADTTACTEIRHEIHRLKREIREQVRVDVREGIRAGMRRH